MKEVDRAAKKALIFFYSSYLENGLTDEVKLTAKKIHLEFAPATPLLDPYLHKLTNSLIDFYIDMGETLPADGEVRDLLQEIDKYIES